MSNLDQPTPESLLGIDSFETIPRFVAKVETVASGPSGPEQKDNSLESTIKGGFSITKSDSEKHPDESEHDANSDTNADSGDPLIGEMFGHFRIESVIASGGMGTVYEATQLKPVRRRVALKMIRAGMADEATIQRFHAERQALAMMDHPDIAQVYEANTSGDGHPYFAMEYCSGFPIDEYCNKYNLNIKERIKLALRIARAVHRAHSQGVIHRDLKPGNVLVSKTDGQPTLKIIDFGIAKFTDDQWQDIAGAATQIGEMVGTPAYMSPEQAGAERIDARTDVFAIGAILFKLLTGTTPLLPPERSCESLTDIICHIQQFEPVIPTQRLKNSSVEFQAEVASTMGFAKVTKLVSKLRGDLDWICLKAIEKDKTDRYATADDLADDLAKFLDKKPVSAAAPTITYRLRKFYQRRSIAVIASSAVLIAATVFGTLYGVNEWERESKRLANIEQVSGEAQQLIQQAETARERAGLGGPHSEIEFVTAQTAIARAESMLEDTPSLKSLQFELSQTKQAIEFDQRAFNLVAMLNDARERATNIETEEQDDAFGGEQGIALLVEAFEKNGVSFQNTTPDEAVEFLNKCPRSTLPKFMEALDFVIAEEPIGSGLHLQQQDNRITIHDVVDGGAAKASGKLKRGDRILRINDVDLLDYDTNHLRAAAYRLLTGKPGTKIQLELVRGADDPFTVELQCRGEKAHWAHLVLKQLDTNPWREELRTAVLAADLPKLHELAKSPELADQKPFSLIQLSTMMFLLERSNESIEFLSLCQKRNPGNFWANHYLGTALNVAHSPPRPEEAIRYLTAAVALRPKSIGARTNLATAYFLSGEYDSELDQLRVVAAMDPNHVPVRIRIERLQKEFGQLARQSNSKTTVHSDTRSKTETEQLMEAVDAQDSGVFSEDQVEFWESKARKLALQGNRKQALKTIVAAERKFPESPVLRRAKGVVLLDLGDYAAARIILADAARRLPSDAATRFYHGIALQGVGNSRDAINEYKAAIAIRPDYSAASDALRSLETE